MSNYVTASYEDHDCDSVSGEMSCHSGQVPTSIGLPCSLSVQPGPYSSRGKCCSPFPKNFSAPFADVTPEEDGFVVAFYTHCDPSQTDLSDTYTEVTTNHHPPEWWLSGLPDPNAVYAPALATDRSLDP